VNSLAHGPVPVVRRLAIGPALALAVAAAGCADAPTSPAPPARPAARTQADVTPQSTACPPGTQSSSGALPGSGALYLICIPPPAAWNGSLVVYAHGYVNPFDPVAIQDDVVGGLTVSQITTGLGFAFATTSYRNNGLIIFEGEWDLLRLVQTFRQVSGGGQVPGLTLAVGASEGALIALLATERFPQLFDGTLALCGPLSDLGIQLNYLDDFRVLFDWFFPASSQEHRGRAGPRGPGVAPPHRSPRLAPDRGARGARQ
jgi:pimeloyl-ACP methyl ester carboxylesterase